MNMPVKIVFFGSPTFAGKILEHLVDQPDRYEVVGVVTSPDRPVGRHQEMTPSPVAFVATKYHLPTFKPITLDSANLAHVKLLEADIFLVAAYGKIIPPDWLTAPKLSTLNIHFSLLPKYRGALCVSEALKNGDSQTGVTLMEMDEALDHGPIIAQEKTEIASNDNVATLTEKLVSLSFRLLDEHLVPYLSGALKPQVQDESAAEYTPSHKSRTRLHAFVPWSELAAAREGLGAVKTHNLVRSLNPDPGAWTKIEVNGKDLEVKLRETKLVEGKLVPVLVQLTGKQPIPWSQFEAGYLQQ